MFGKKENHEAGTDVRVRVDVTNIVKYACVTGAFIVAIIFISKSLGNCRCKK